MQWVLELKGFTCCTVCLKIGFKVTTVLHLTIRDLPGICIYAPSPQAYICVSRAHVTTVTCKIQFSSAKGNLMSNHLQ